MLGGCGGNWDDRWLWLQLSCWEVCGCYRFDRRKEGTDRVWVVTAFRWPLG